MLEIFTKMLQRIEEIMGIYKTVDESSQSADHEMNDDILILIT